MPLPDLLAKAYAIARCEHIPLAPPYPFCTLFFSVSSGKERARVVTANGEDFEQAWRDGFGYIQREAERLDAPPRWLRVDWVFTAQSETWASLNKRLTKTKRNYFRFGLALDAGFTQALTEQELNANAMLYPGQTQAAAQLQPKNFTRYLQQRFGSRLKPDFSADRPVWVLATRGVFCEPGAPARLLTGPGRNAGRRMQPPLDAETTLDLVTRASRFLARQVQPDGRFIYGYHPCFDRRISSYNALRHASTTYSMVEAWELTREAELEAAIERALNYLVEQLIQRTDTPDGLTRAFVVDTGNEIKLGANAVAILALTKYREVAGSNEHADLLEQLALGIDYMQDPETGAFRHVITWPDLALRDAFRIIYYDGEAAFALMRLYGQTRDPRWLAIVERAFEHFIASGHEKAHDHWLSYCVNELTLHRPDEHLFRFGLRNVAGHLDFVIERITTFPTLLELMMAAERMLRRIDSLPEHRHLLAEIDLKKFYSALHHRANYLLNGHFWPEIAMYFARPECIVDSFFIRHHSFRVRIDDVEHYLSGLVAYWKYLQEGEPRVSAGSRGTAKPSAIIAWGGDVNIGRRMHYKVRQIGMEAPLAELISFKQADLTIVNLECVISAELAPGAEKGERGPYYFRARPDMLEVLDSAGVDIVCTANNHSGDLGPAALMEQQSWLELAGILNTGSGRTLEMALRPVTTRAGKLNVALFSIDATLPHFAASKSKAGNAYLPLEPATLWHETFEPRIREARKKADVVLVAVHWQWPPTPTPTEAKRRAGQALIDAGADAVVGASGHFLHGVETYRGRPIIHDAGDLLFDSLDESRKDGGYFTLEASEHGINRIVFHPTRLRFGYTEALCSQAARSAAEDYAKKSQMLGSTCELTTDNLCTIEFTPPKRAQREVPAYPSPRRLLPDFRPFEQHWVEKGRVYTIPDKAKCEATMLGPLNLLGCELSPTHLDQRAMVWITTYWQTETELEADFLIRVRLIPVSTADGIWGKGSEHDPCDWLAPTSRWKCGVIYRDHFGIRPPAADRLRNGKMYVEIAVLSGDRNDTLGLLTLPLSVELAMPTSAYKPATAPLEATAKRLSDCKYTQVYFLNTQLGLVRSGIENAALLRSHVFKTALGHAPNILTIDYDSTLDTTRTKLRTSGTLPPDVKLVNLYEHYQEATDTSKLTEEDKIDSLMPDWPRTPVPNTEDMRLRMPDGSASLYCKYSAGRLAYINHFAHGFKWRRDTFDSRGFLSRVQYLARGAGTPTNEQFLRPDGSIAIVRHWNFDGQRNRLQATHLLDRNGMTRAAFVEDDDLIQYWIEELTADRTTAHVMILDRSERYLGALTKTAHSKRRPNIVLLPHLHNAHMSEGHPLKGKLRGYVKRLIREYHCFDAVIVLTDRQAEDMATRFGLSSAPHVIPHAVWQLSPNRPVQRERTRLIYVARYDRDKNHDAALRIIERVRKVIPEIRLDCYGYGGERARLETQAIAMGLEGHVAFHGFTSNIVQIYREAGISILTSRREGFSLSLKESLTHGCPAIAFDVPYGPSALIRSAINGYLVPFGDESLFAERIIAVLEDETLHKSLIKQAPESVETAFGMCKVARHWKDLFQELQLPKLMPISDLSGSGINHQR
jgi:glycosyltransferase involved in cell wall biosynthesis